MDKKELMRAVKFTLFSISAGIIQLLSFTLMNEVFPWSYWVCYLTALILSVLWNFTLNRKVTFRSANNVPDRDAQGRGLLPRVHTAVHLGRGLAHRYWLERVCRAYRFHAAELRHGVPV